MTVNIENLDGLKRQFTVTVPADELQKSYQKRLATVSKQASLKGFRPGKVPAKVVEQKFGKSVLQEAAIDLVQSTFDDAIKESKLTVAGRPDIDFDPEKLKKDEAFDYTAKFEVYPEISLKDLAGEEVEAVSGEITDEDINAMLIKLRTQHADWVDVSDRAAKLGDRVKIDFDGVIDGKPLDQGSAKDHWLELGSKSMIPGFEDGLIGAKKGEEKKLEISFPDDYHVEALRGKPVTFTVKVHEVQEPKLPALDDEFAKKLGVEEGLDALKEKVKERLSSELENTTKGLKKQAVLDKLMALNPIDVPVALVDMEIANLQEMTRKQMRYYLKDTPNADVDKFPLSKEPYMDEAKKRVVLGLLLAEVIKKNELKVDEKAVNDKIEEIAAGYPNASEVAQMYRNNKQMFAEIQSAVLEEAAINKLLEKATVKDVKKSYDAIINAAQNEQAAA